MDCLIDNIITRWHVGKGKRVEVIKRYIRMRYKINIDATSIQNRVRDMGHELA